ncbi:VOC family protein [Chloroflexota bacterium]
MPEKVIVNYVDHISIAVKDIKKAEKDYQNVFGWEVAGRYINRDEKIGVSYFRVGQTCVELMEDLDGTGEVAKFIAKRGEGVMLISYNVDDAGEALGLLKANGAKLIDQEPRLWKERGGKYAFIHPHAVHGVLTEVADGRY